MLTERAILLQLAGGDNGILVFVLQISSYIVAVGSLFCLVYEAHKWVLTFLLYLLQQQSIS